MKSINSVFNKICSSENLWNAYLRARKGKRRTIACANFEVNVEAHLFEIKEQLLRGYYKPKPYKMMFIRDPKLRPIVISDFGDRVVHQAIYHILGPFYERSYIDQTYSCLINRGTHKALLHYLKATRAYKYRLHLDIARYFPSIDHQILKNILFAKLKDKRVRHLIHTIIKSSEGLYMKKSIITIWRKQAEEKGQLFVPPKKYTGLPIGTLMSQWWANQYLNEMDHYIKRVLKIKHYQRYMDDHTLFSNSANQLKEAHQQIQDWLTTRRKLALNPKSKGVRPSKEPSVYLGYRISPAGLCVGPIARKRMKQRIKKRI